MNENVDIVVAGAGNAAMCAALSARESGARVLILERSPESQTGGNSRYTAGAMRVVYNNVDDLRSIMPDLSDDEVNNADFGTYTADQFYDDMCRITQYRSDPELTDILIENSLATLQWMHGKGVRFLPMYGRQAFKVDGKFKFWGGLTVEAWGGGEGLIDNLHKALDKNDIPIRYNSRVMDITTTEGKISGVIVQHRGEETRIGCAAVILACGGFEANSEWRTRYLGPGWELAKVRGTRYNTGDGIRMGLDLSAAPHGNWSGCHAVSWDRNAPEYGDLAVGDGFQKHSYPLGLMVNASGERFVDEGADFRNYTYARYGREVLNQPAQFAWQVFDSKVSDMLRDEYRIRQVSKVQADTIADLAAKLEGVDGDRFQQTIVEFNNAVQTHIPFNPAIKDGRSTTGLAVNKSNWANPLDGPPYSAFQVTCGITFTFGGLKINSNASVVDQDEYAIPGLFAAGEMVGGLFYFNYPGGSGLTSGAVFGRIAGRSAAAYISENL